MEKIIDLVFSNPIIAIAILGFLFSLLGKGKKQTNRMPSFGGDQRAGDSSGRQSHGEQDDEGEQLFEEPAPQSQTLMSESPSLAADSSGTAMRTSSSYQERQAMSHRAVATRDSMHAPNPIEEDEIQDEWQQAGVSVEDARRGVIWAEIIGPPRSKRPHGQR
ncbi:hypothetical protein MH117_10485 [Paenibacillus sp. ACRRX]|uniref:hypothetical protein n=1 Tax=unclassified Paenibacillus TaxID=185978 RepID=UPI001EF70B45|nr:MULTISPECIES: hypothetical protein [unclassified Paenibacillus]MCG7407848.1 hypothetical protein [Paenibacillus sp. ACRRX]MDK8180991.1 hypothetical protein [Paenibacillus sp. UMB4589-SE434]